MRPPTKKWIATSIEIALVIAFAGFGFLAADEIKQWYRNGLTIEPPKVVWLWLLIGTLLGVARYLTSRYGRQEALGILSTPAFIEAYRKTLERALKTLVSVLRASAASPLVPLEEAETAVIKAIIDVVDHFRSATANRQTSINCIVMEPTLYDDVKHGSIEILGLEPGGRGRLKFLLSIVKMAREEIEIPMIHLPVYDLGSDFRDRNSFGAPRAFVTGEKQIINFTLWLVPHRGRSSRVAMKELWRYFWRIRTKVLSFASLPVTSNGEVLAVINIHCGWLRVFGKNPIILNDFLIPFLTILSYIYEQRKGSRLA